MKKIFLATAVAATALMSSCNNGAPKANMQTDSDTLSYAMGLSYAGYAQSALTQMQVDSAYLDEFTKGVKEGLLAEDDKQKQAHYMGIMMGMQLNREVQNLEEQLFADSTKELSRKNIISGLGAGLNKKSALKVDGKIITPTEANAFVQAAMQRLFEKAQSERYAAEKKKSEDFIASKRKEADVKVLKGGVLYKVIKAGTGAVPSATDTVKVFYEGRLINGNVFDSSERNNGQPVSMPLSGVIPGWQTALTHMPVGSEWEIYVPWDLAYGAQGQPYGGIAPFSALIFKITLVGIGK